MSIHPRLWAPWRSTAVLALIVVLLGALAPVPAQTAGPRPPPALACPLLGVNLSGGEFGSTLPGVYGVDYLYPGVNAMGYDNEWELDYFHSKGLNLIRLNVQWERLQHDLNGPLTTFDLDLIDQVLANAAARGMTVILSPHNFARRQINGTDYLIGSAQVPYAAFTDFWQRMAAHFAGRPGLYGYSLDNEPHDTGGLWVTGGAQAGINGIRLADTAAPILVPGDGWSAAWQWVANGNDALRTLSDPAQNLIFDAHQYFDGDNSGTYAQPYDQQGAYPTLGVDRLQPFVTWLHTYGLRGMVTEYGVPDDDARWWTLLDNALAYLQQNNDVILGGADWSAGPWWDTTYRLSVEPTGTWPTVTDRPQMSVLAARAVCSTTCTITFSDVDQNNPFYPFIRCLACRGIVSGYSDGTFRWGANVTRGQLSKIIAGAAAYADPIPTTQQTFEDVPPANAFWLFVERLAGHGAISGYQCGGAGEPCGVGNRPYFRWAANATRGQISKIDAIAASISDPIPTTQQTFEDAPTSNPFWLWIEQLAGRGVISGYGCGGAGEPCVPPDNRPYFRSNATATRGQLSKIAANSFYPNCQTPQR
jgi:endoglucanase